MRVVGKDGGWRGGGGELKLPRADGWKYNDVI